VVLAALSFLTPLGGARAPSAGTLKWFPLVGAALGLALGGIWWGAHRIWPAAVAAAIVVVGDLALTGLLHFDGLVDSADGLLPHLSLQRRLEVMASPEAGAFGVGAGAAVILARWAALYSLRPAVLLLAGTWCFSRTAMAAVARSQPYARGESGLATAFQGRDAATWVALTAGLAAAVGFVCAWRVVPGLVSLATGAVAVVAVVGLARRRIGGYTGDVLGAAGLVGETVTVLVAAARW
jgi:adenosylcobinamide-GDP ribazoletransferase